MTRKPIPLLLILLLMVPGCRKEGAITDEPATETGSGTVSAESSTTPPPNVRELLEEVQPAIPIWPGSRLTDNPVRHEGPDTIIDLWSNDPFPMVWHYYVTYLAQYRAWEPIDPYPSSGDVGRHLDLDLTTVMQDPFVPGTAIDRNDVEVKLMIREDPTRNRVNIRYVIRPAG